MAKARCPGCDKPQEQPLCPPEYEGNWWCTDCLHAKCHKAWTETETYKNREKADA